MLDATTIEQRLQTLEAEVAALKKQAKLPPSEGNWLEKLIGSISDVEGFEKVLEYGQAFRNKREKLKD